MTTTTDPVLALLDRLRALGHDPDLDELVASALLPVTDWCWRSEDDPSADGFAAADLVAFETALLGHRAYGLGARHSLVRLAVVSRLALFVLPTPSADRFGRYQVRDYLPGATEPCEHEVREAGLRLRTYLDEHDHGEWIDPLHLAGAVADVHDAALMVLAEHDLLALRNGALPW